MPRPKTEQPTPNELEVLKIVWDRGPCTVRDVMEELEKRRHKRAYTSVMSLMNVMTDKGLLVRKPQGKAFSYRARSDRGQTLGRMVKNLLGRAFEGSASALVAQLLDETNPSAAEIEEIRKALDQYRKQQKEAHP